MATQLQLRRGTTAENDVFTGAVGELTMDTDKNDIRLHDGVTPGGHKISMFGYGIPDYSAGVVVSNNYVTTFPCYAVARNPNNAMTQTGVSIYVDNIKVFSSSNGNSNANKTFCAVCYVGAGHTVSYSGDGTIEMTIYPLIGANI